MPDMLAIVSKAVFEREAGKSPALGTRLGMDRYVSSNKNLDPLASGGRLYLVTVRPPKEDLWLVAILDQPKHDGEAWIARKCATPITDITKLKSKLKFQSGTGIQAKKGALGMSLQTPRALTAADAALLDKAAGVTASTAGTAGAAPSPALAPVPAEEDAPGAPGAESLLEAILADPDNDDARRIYADLLAQGGDPRGELIFVELALDGPLSIRKRAELAPRRRELYEANKKRWFPYALAGMRTHHGFLQAVKGSLKQLKAAGSKLFAVEPVTEVEVTDVDEETAEPLLAAKWLPRVRRLILRGAIGDEGFAQICASRATAGLRTLNVNSNELGADALAELGDGLPACTTLVLSGNSIGDEGLAGLREWKHLAGIETLYLSRCEISAEGLGTLLGGLTLPRLEKLCLTDNDELGDEAAGAIAASAAGLPKLRHIEVMNTGIGEAGIRALTAAKLPALRRIDARRNYLDDEELDGKLTADPRVRT